MKRIRPRAKGRADRIVKRTSHIIVTVGDGKNGAGKPRNRKAQAPKAEAATKEGK
jgi:hypothetical protein